MIFGIDTRGFGDEKYMPNRYEDEYGVIEGVVTEKMGSYIFLAGDVPATRLKIVHGMDKVTPKITRFRDIEQFSKEGNYEIGVPWKHLESFIEDYGSPLDLDPDFQRGHVWSRQQQIAYVEFKLRGGRGSDQLRFNCPHFQTYEGDGTEVTELVDGKQRLEAVRAFLADEFPVFGSYYSEFEDKLDITKYRFSVMINDLPTRSAVLKWYLEINSGGVVHSDDELSRVRGMLDDELAAEQSSTSSYKP